MELSESLSEKLESLRSGDLYRRMVCVDSAQGPSVTIEGREYACFCSNNYLNLAADPRIIEAAVTALTRYGQGAAASRLMSGTMRPHAELEAAFAKLFGKETALIFPAGWMANDAVLRTLPGRGDLVLIDKLDHASIIDAAAGSDADVRTYRRGSADRIEKLLARHYKHKFIVTESVFSMDGHAADLASLVEIKKKYGAILVVDEAHAIGCLGKNAEGLAGQLNLLDQVDIVVATMSKALGSAGAVAAAKRTIIEFLVNRARSFIYTTAPPPAVCAAAAAALRIARTEPGRRQRLRENADRLRAGLKRLGLDTGRSESHIIPIMIGQSRQALAASRMLMEKGFFVPAIRPPTVPPNTARLRISVQSGHTAEQMDGLCEALAGL